MRSCKCEHWQVCDECRPKEWRNEMTNQERADWLNTMNQHKAAGGKLECKGTTDWFATSDNGPSWNSNPENWRIVPLPRKAKFLVAYRWNIEGTVYHKFIADSDVAAYKDVGGWQVKEIELEESP